MLRVLGQVVSLMRRVTQRRTPAARRAAWRPSWPFMEAPWNGFGRSGWRVPRDRRVAELEEHSRVRDTADSGSDLDDSDESGDEEDRKLRKRNQTQDTKQK
eukprot:COSAG06_NODE_4956_length_3832_cov_17.189660_4_plen_101_part_00